MRRSPRRPDSLRRPLARLKVARSVTRGSLGRTRRRRTTRAGRRFRTVSYAIHSSPFQLGKRDGAASQAQTPRRAEIPLEFAHEADPSELDRGSRSTRSRFTPVRRGRRDPTRFTLGVLVFTRRHELAGRERPRGGIGERRDDLGEGAKVKVEHAPDRVLAVKDVSLGGQHAREGGVVVGLGER